METPHVRQRTRPQAANRINDERKGRLAEQVASGDPFDLNELFPIEELPADLGSRARNIRCRNKEYTKEFILSTLHQLMLARMPLDQIAQRFQVSVRTIVRWRRELSNHLAEEAKRIDPLPLLGETIAHYRQLRAQGWKLVLGGKTTADIRAGAEIAKSAESELMKVLQVSGFFDTPHLRPAAPDENNRAQNAGLLAELSREFLAMATGEGTLLPSDLPRGAWLAADDEVVDVEPDDDMSLLGF